MRSDTWLKSLALVAAWRVVCGDMVGAGHQSGAAITRVQADVGLRGTHEGKKWLNSECNSKRAIRVCSQIGGG